MPDKSQDYFALQVALVKGRGGIGTAVAQYDRMFRDMSVPTAIVYEGPPVDAFSGRDDAMIPPPALLASPIAPAFAFLLQGFRSEIMRRAGNSRLLIIVHSDRSLGVLRKLFPQAVTVTPCHSDKMKRKHRAHLIVTLNTEQQKLAMEAVPGARVAMLGNPYFANPALRPTANGSPRLNFVARHTEIKDPLTLLRAVQLLPKEIVPEVRFFGEGPLLETVKAEAAKTGLNIAFPGWHNAPFSTFHMNDILVLPSIWEGLPYLLLEALDHGVPIVASDIAGNRAALFDGSYGLHFNAGDPASLAATLTKALSDVGRLRAMSASGKATLDERFSSASFWKKLEAECAPFFGDRNR
jgi:glycosyltransferase involved in cell wall biosynthesis